MIRKPHHLAHGDCTSAASGGAAYSNTAKYRLYLRRLAAVNPVQEPVSHRETAAIVGLMLGTYASHAHQHCTVRIV